MDAVFKCRPLGGEVKAIASKSIAHRVLLCSAFASSPTTIYCPEVNDDILATARVLNCIGAEISRTKQGFYVVPASEYKQNALLDCGESGSTLRFILPVLFACGIGAELIRKGKLSERPLSPLKEELEKHGAVFELNNTTLKTKGRISPGDYTISGDISSQFISGLLLALPLLDAESTLTVTGKIESAGYIDITLDALKHFGVTPVITETQAGRVYRISPIGKYLPLESIRINGDWSNAAVWLAAGTIGKNPVTVSGIKSDAQGDRIIVDILRRFGAKISQNAEQIIAYPSELTAACFNASQFPDLVPVLAVAAAAANGVTVISGVRRLRIKECDRLTAICELMTQLGASVKNEEDSLIITGGKRLHGGAVFSYGDHRMVMCAFLASLLSDEAVTVKNAQAITKSYPDFFKHITALGGEVSLLQP